MYTVDLEWLLYIKEQDILTQAKTYVMNTQGEISVDSHADVYYSFTEGWNRGHLQAMVNPGRQWKTNNTSQPYKQNKMN
jgi:hypothetical protein